MVTQGQAGEEVEVLVEGVLAEEIQVEDWGYEVYAARVSVRSPTSLMRLYHGSKPWSIGLSNSTGAIYSFTHRRST